MAFALALFWLVAAAGQAAGDAPRAFPPGERPNDRRLEPLKDLDGYFPFHPSPSKEQWDRRAEELRQQMLVALGLWPMPTKTPLNPVIHGRIEREGYTVEKVYFESVPGFYVTGSLYRPKDKPGKHPGVLCPHGHWENGRFMDAGAEAVRRSIVQGAERFEEGGRSPLQSRCVQLARMGCVVFHYDMIGYADSQQISEAVAHRFAKQRPEMNTVENWGLFSPQAEAHLQSVMGLQTWNSIRALDFLLDLPDVDRERVGVTGASGGGTQTFVLCALDPRPTVAFPAVMVSTAMQGGCTCENASLLRVETGNVEFAALFAPKPLGMTAADDWTHEMPVKGFPELQQHYKMLGAPDKVHLTPLLHFGHNYNYVSRAALYSWFNKQLKLGLSEPVVENDYQRLSEQELSVWDSTHRRPPAGPEFERKLLHWLDEDAQQRIAQAAKSDQDLHRVIGGAVDVLIGRKLESAGTAEWFATTTHDRGTYTEAVGLLTNPAHQEELPAVILRPKKETGPVVIWATDTGKAGLFATGGANGELRPEIRKLLAAGATVIGLDLFEQGEFLADGKPITRTHTVNNPREAAAYTFGYNRALFAQRTADLLTTISFVTAEHPDADLCLVALDRTGPIAAAARAQAARAVKRAAIDTGGFRFGKLLDLRDPNFLPGGAKYGDLPGLLALGAPGKLWLGGESGEAPSLTREAYERSSRAAELTIAPNAVTDEPSAVVDWLLKQD